MIPVRIDACSTARGTRRRRGAPLARVAAAGIALFTIAVPAAGIARDRIEVGKPFPRLLLPRLSDGKLVSSGDLRGKKTLLLVFASW